MSRSNPGRVAAALLAIALLPTPTAAVADIRDYEFKLVREQIKKGLSVVDVRLIHKPDDRAVPDAVIFALRLDMAPDDMEQMTGAIEPVKSPEPGLYRFKVDLTDEGRWRISLAAKIQGEAETLQSRLVLKATP
ncbi:MAG: FixH family protein [Methylocystis sp.]|uniref:FixH family protein n=1 Tax=Methylocystis sp. TaxID=1911079 RepID=UPI003DA4394A